MSRPSGALEAIDRILNRGGDADDVLRGVLAVIHERAGYSWAAIRFVEAGGLVEGPSVGTKIEGLTVPVSYQGEKVGELELGGGPGNRAFAEHGANIVAYGGSTEDQLAKNWYTAELGDVKALRALLTALRNVDAVFDAYRVTPS